MTDAKRWLDAAEEDFSAADFNRDGGKLPYAAFLYQQAVEKGLKSLLIEIGEGLHRTHDCFILAKKAGAPQKILELADELTPYYFRTRYPDAGDVEMSEEDLDRIHKTASEVMTWIKK